MKKILLILGLFICQLVKGQSATIEIPMGFYPRNEYDTVKAVLLITECDDCQSRSISAFAVRRRYEYVGDRMPTFGNYSDQWRIQFYLDNNKKGLSNKIIIWDSKLKL